MPIYLSQNVHWNVAVHEVEHEEHDQEARARKTVVDQIVQYRAAPEENWRNSRKNLLKINKDFINITNLSVNKKSLMIPRKVTPMFLGI